MLEPDQITQVTKQYDWTGRLTGYRIGNTLIPIDSGNRHYRGVVQRIQSGECMELEPTVEFAICTISREGNITGYETNLGFVPKQTDNQLYNLLEEHIQQHGLKPREPEMHEPQPRLKTIIMCSIFPKKWEHIADEISKSFDHPRRSGSGNPVSCVVRAKNIPSDQNADDALDELKNLGYPVPDFGQSISFMSIQLGMIELEIPVDGLKILYKSERDFIPSTHKNFFNQIVEENLVKTARRKSEGPSIDFLINYAQYYLTPFYVNTVNAMVRDLTLEYGGNPPGHVSETDLYKTSFIFGRDDEDNLRLVGISKQGEHSFGLSGHLPDRGNARFPSRQVANQEITVWEVNTRIRLLIDSGFAPEAIVVASAFAERILRDLLGHMVTGCEGIEQSLSSLGHRSRLEIFGNLARANILPDHRGARFSSILGKFEAIYQHRNDYAHDLKTTGDNHWDFVEIDRQATELLDLFLDVFKNHTSFGELSSIAGSQDNRVTQFLIDEINSRAPGNCPK